MQIQNPRIHLVNIRLSPEEFAALEQATRASEARTLSEFVPRAILSSAGVRNYSDFSAVVRRLESLEKHVKQLAEVIPTPSL